MALNENFGFTPRGVNQRILCGPEGFRAYFNFLDDVYLGLQQGPMVSDLFQVMNPEEILAASAGWAEVARQRNRTIVTDPSRFYSQVVRVAFGSYARILNTIKAHAEERGVAPFTTSKGDLAQRVEEIFDCRPRVREILDVDKLRDTIERGLHERHFNSDAPRSMASRQKYAGAISRILHDKYLSYERRFPAEYYLGEARIALARNDREELDNLLRDRIPIILEKAIDDDVRVMEYCGIHDSVCQPGIRANPPY